MVQMVPVHSTLSLATVRMTMHMEGAMLTGCTGINEVGMNAAKHTGHTESKHHWVMPQL